MYKTLFHSKKLIPLFIIIVLIVLFGFIRPLFSASSTSYLFGAIEKEPNSKKLIKEFFKQQIANSNDGKIFQPFSKFVMNLPSDFDPNMDRSRYTYQELASMQRDATRWDYETSNKVINKLELVSCEKQIIYNTIGYSCELVLNDLKGTNLYDEHVKGRAIPFFVNIMNQDGKYKAIDFFSR